MNKELNLKNILIDIGLVGLYGAFQWFLILVLTVFILGIFPCQGDLLKETSYLKIFIFLLFLFSLIELFFVNKWYSKRTNIFKYSAWVLYSIIPIYIFCYLGELYFTERYYMDFDSQKWKSYQSKPLSMIHTINEDEILKGKSKNEVINLLGNGEIRDSNSIYYESTDSDYLIVYFENGTFTSLAISCD